VIDDILGGVQRRGGTPEELVLELELALEHLLEQFGLVLQRSREITRRSGRPRSQRGGHPAEVADRAVATTSAGQRDQSFSFPSALPARPENERTCTVAHRDVHHLIAPDGRSRRSANAAPPSAAAKTSRAQRQAAADSRSARSQFASGSDSPSSRWMK
jgi:hypothetical protein